jgi:hypothetical protein
MKNTVIALSLISISAIGQSSIEKLPSFYDQTEGNKIIGVDMESNGVEPIVLYTTYNHNEVNCKMWDGQEWVAFGVFPSVKNRGQVNLELHNRNGYALLQGGDGWSLYEKKKGSEKWEVFGTPNFAGTSDLSHPTLTFIEGNPVIYERHYREDRVDMFKYQNGEILNLKAVSQFTDVNDDFTMVSNTEDQMIMGWTTADKGDLQLFEINKSGDETSQKTITKGLKTKEVKRIQDLFYHKGTLYLYYLNSSWELKVGKYNRSTAKWEMMDSGSTIDGLGFYQANDLSFVTKSRDNDLPVFYKYNGSSWAKEVEIGKEKIFHGLEVKLAEALGEYYLLNFNAKGETLVQKFTMD